MDDGFCDRHDFLGCGTGKGGPQTFIERDRDVHYEECLARVYEHLRCLETTLMDPFSKSRRVFQITTDLLRIHVRSSVRVVLRSYVAECRENGQPYIVNH